MLEEIGSIRLHHQQISDTTFTTAREIVSWLGAVQAQDFAMAKWALGVRLPHATNSQIEAALNTGEIIRTHILRPTWHFVSAADIYWLLALTAPQIRITLKSRFKELELTEATVNKSNVVLEKALTNHDYLTRAALVAELHQSGIATDNNRASHLLMYAELDAIICSGPIQNNKPTYALLPRRVPQQQTLTRDEALAKLAIIYFRSHGPATVHDFAWWSGLTVTDARQGLELIKPQLITETVNGNPYWFSSNLTNRTNAILPPTNFYLLPAFDEFIISYKDRTAILSAGHHTKAISENGIFRPVMVMNGKVTGLWQRTIKKDKLLITANFFQAPPTVAMPLLQVAAQKYARFLEKKPEVITSY